jgi:nucleoside-diphosphate-sugar epimerase
MQKILITGSSGFIGKYLTKRLESSYKLHHLQSDLRDYDTVRQEVLAFDPNIVIHLAARTEVESSFYEQITFSEINYVGSVNLIETAKECSDLQLFLAASTMETYGWQPISGVVESGVEINPPEYWAFTEETSQNPMAPYAVAKVGMEKYLQYANRAYGLPFALIRTTNCYGRWDNNFFVTESIISQMATLQEINLGYKEPYRNFIFIDDLIDLYERIIKYPSAAATGQIFCCGPNNPIKIEHYADKIAKLMDWSGKINWDTRPHRPGEIYYLSSKNDKARLYFDWQPRVSLEDGLKKTIEIWRSR